MKADTTTVMRKMIQQIREEFPFELGEEQLCTDTCSVGCPLKLLEYMEQEVLEWEARLDQGEVPNFRDLQSLEKTGKKIHDVLQKNQLVEPPQP